MNIPLLGLCLLSAGVSERGEKTGDPIQAQLIIIQGATPILESRSIHPGNMAPHHQTKKRLTNQRPINFLTNALQRFDPPPYSGCPKHASSNVHQFLSVQHHYFLSVTEKVGCSLKGFGMIVLGWMGFFVGFP